MSPPFSLKQYRQATAEYENNWKSIDQNLYALCRQYPDQTNRLGVNAKLWLIGRSYATGIERKIRSTGAQGSSMSQLSDHFHARSCFLNSLLGPLTQVREPINKNKLKVIVQIHGRFVAMLMHHRQVPRSFASKYMHFHCPAVPIYDSYAAAALRQLVRWHNDLVFDLSAVADNEYGWFVMRFLELYQLAKTVEKKATVKHLDCYLGWVAYHGVE
jgi:hypothetical protein